MKGCGRALKFMTGYVMLWKLIYMSWNVQQISLKIMEGILKLWNVMKGHRKSWMVIES